MFYVVRKSWDKCCLPEATGQPESDNNLITTVSGLWPKVGDGVDRAGAHLQLLLKDAIASAGCRREQRSAQTIALFSSLSLTVREGREAVTPAPMVSALLTGS